jgi:signal transduction histidine kinase
VTASAPELSRIVANLLLNAIRYTPSDGTVTVTGGRDGEGSWLAVSDTCGGIAEPTYRASSTSPTAAATRSARTPGAGGGFGLAIVRGLVEAHGGRVAVENVGGGCRFTVRLPRS